MSPETGRQATRPIAASMTRSIGSLTAASPTTTLSSSDNAIVRQLMIRLLTGKGTHVSSNCRPGLVPDGYHHVNYERNPAVCREEAIVAHASAGATGALSRDRGTRFERRVAGKRRRRKPDRKSTRLNSSH